MEIVRKRARKSLWREIVVNRWTYLLLAPGFVFLLLVKYVPMYGIQIAFKDFNPFLGIWQSPWVGLDYFALAFKSEVFWRAFRNTIVIALAKFIIGSPAPILLALMLNQVRIFIVKRFVQTISYFPHMISWAVVGGLAYTFLGSSGLINKLLVSMGLDPVMFYLNADVWLPVFVMTDVWKGIGWGSILYLAALSAVNTELYEAIEVDGGGRFQKIRYVDLPVLMPIFGVLLILNTVNLVAGDFDQIYALVGDSIVSPNSLLNSRIETLEVYTYRLGLLQGKFSYGGAIGFFQNVLSFILIISANFIARRVFDDRRYTLY